METFVDVILPLPLRRTFTYSLPQGIAGAVRTGCRVTVPFGRKNYYTGIVKAVHYTRPMEYEVKPVAALPDAQPVLLPRQLKFWEWLSDYYLCSLGDVFKAALPSGLKPESDALADMEALQQACKPKTQTYVRLAESLCEQARLKMLFDALQRRAPKQLDLLMRYLEQSGFLATGQAKAVPKAALLQAGASVAAFNGLTGKHVLEAYSVEVERQDEEASQTVTATAHPLSAPQQAAYEAIQASFRQKNVCLLYGVTAAGKTEIYIHLIEETLRQGRQVLYLLPEIALTTQITERLKRLFGPRLGIYHSKFTDARRVELWLRQLTDKAYDVILGVRSSVFLPFRNLGLVIVDEEHENSYKQQDPAPRYHARNAAIVLAGLYGAKTLLGTATPALESWHNALTGKYGLVTLKERYKAVQLPRVIPVDMQELLRKKIVHGPFSPLLLQLMREALECKQQVILFQNRRGFAPMIECHTCGWVPRCRDCDVSLTYHKGSGQLVCHYCGYTMALPARCPACDGTDLRGHGFGTEKIEDDIRDLFPEARVARMDLDTTHTRTAYERIIADFEAGRTDILIGTQMVSKGLDFDRVSVVGILNADTMLNYPDFRAYERAFQLMAQVAGRAGRKERQGMVVLQTRNVAHPIIPQVMHNDYEGMAAGQLSERQLFRYPPYYRLVYVYLKGREEPRLETMAGAMAARLSTLLGKCVLGPDKPPVARVQTLFIRKIMLKIAPHVSFTAVRRLLLQLQEEMLRDARFKSMQVYYDVDPM
ncbi:MAG: primosomal protein N' [Prevotellaceae bacterium]|nr:primosomal protein N' [Prevotellaceae bacterium]